MREKRTFAQRTKRLKPDEAKRKYFLVYEGSDTESLYFEAVDSMRMAIGIDPLIELIPIIRSYSEEGWSNPRKILDRIIDNLKEDETAYISYETLLNRIMDYLYEEKIITADYNVFACYNSQNCKPKFYDGHLTEDFDLDYSSGLVESIEGYIKYLQESDDELPEEFYQSRVIKKEKSYDKLQQK